MLKRTFLLLFMMLCITTPAAAAEQQLLIEHVEEPLRIEATISPWPLYNGTATLDVRITDTTSGAPLPVAGVNLITKAQSIGRDQRYVAPPVEPRDQALYRSHRLYFAISDTWDVRIEVVTTDGRTIVVPTTVEVASVNSHIAANAVIAVPATLGGVLIAYIGWRIYRQRQKRAV